MIINKYIISFSFTLFNHCSVSWLQTQMKVFLPEVWLWRRSLFARHVWMFTSVVSPSEKSTRKLSNRRLRVPSSLVNDCLLQFTAVTGTRETATIHVYLYKWWDAYSIRVSVRWWKLWDGNEQHGADICLTLCFIVKEFIDVFPVSFITFSLLSQKWNMSWLQHRLCSDGD